MIAELESAPQFISGGGALCLPTCIIYPELGLSLTCRDLLMKHAYQIGRGSISRQVSGQPMRVCLGKKVRAEIERRIESKPVSDVLIIRSVKPGQALSLDSGESFFFSNLLILLASSSPRTIRSILAV